MVILIEIINLEMSLKLVEFDVSDMSETSPEIQIYYKKIPIKLKITSIDQLIPYLGQCIIIYNTSKIGQIIFLPDLT